MGCYSFVTFSLIYRLLDGHDDLSLWTMHSLAFIYIDTAISLLPGAKWAIRGQSIDIRAQTYFALERGAQSGNKIYRGAVHVEVLYCERSMNETVSPKFLTNTIWSGEEIEQRMKRV